MAREIKTVEGNILEDKTIKHWKNLNKSEYAKNLVRKNLPFYFDRGFCDGYRKYDGYYALPKEVAEKATYGKLDFQCVELKIYDAHDNLIHTSVTDCYDTGERITASVVFSDDCNNCFTVV